MSQANKIKVTLVKSVIGTKESHRACVRGFNKVYYLVKWEA